MRLELALTQTTLGVQLLAYLADPLFPGLQGPRAGMHRVIAQFQRMRVPDGGPEDERADAERREREPRFAISMEIAYVMHQVYGDERVHAPRFCLAYSTIHSRGRRCGQCGIVGIAFGTAAVVACRVRRVQRRTAPEALDQIGVGQERLPERDQIG